MQSITQPKVRAGCSPEAGNRREARELGDGGTDATPQQRSGPGWRGGEVPRAGPLTMGGEPRVPALWAKTQSRLAPKPGLPQLLECLAAGSSR